MTHARPGEEVKPAKAKCSGHSSQTGKPCGNYPIRGAKVCGSHGGKAKQVRRAAERRQAVAGAETAVSRLASVAGPVEPVVDPLSALASLAGEVLRWKDLLAAHVAELESLRYSGAAGEQVRGEIQLFGQALDRCNTVLTSFAKLNIDERLAVVEERRADVVARFIRAVLADGELGLTEEQAAVAPSVVVRHLRSIS